MICQVNRIRIFKNPCETPDRVFVCKAPDGRVLEQFAGLKAAKDWAVRTLDFIRKKPRTICLMVFAKGTVDVPKAHMQKICSGIEGRTQYVVHLDAGGPNRENPTEQDPATLLIEAGGRRWKIPVSDLAKQLAKLPATYVRA